MYILLNETSHKCLFVSSLPEGQIPKGAVYLGKKEIIDGDVKHTDEYYAVPQEGEETKTTKVVEQKPKIYPGIGPLDEEGVPLAFRKVRSSQ